MGITQHCQYNDMNQMYVTAVLVLTVHHTTIKIMCWMRMTVSNFANSIHHHHHQSLNREGRWGTTDDTATSFLHFFLFSTALWDFAELQACPFPDVVFPPLSLSALPPSPFHCALQDGFGQTWWTGNMAIPLQFASLRSSGGLHVVQLPAGSWHGLSRW